MKKTILAIIAVFIAWSILDFLIHGVILKTAYENTQDLWRPMEDMEMGLMSVVTAISAIAFTLIYSLLVNKKTLSAGLKFGLLFGFGVGTSMGFGTYCVMPIPLSMAITWLLGMLVEATVAGVIVGLVVKPVDTTIEQPL